MQSALFRSVARLDTLANIARANVEREGTLNPHASDALVKAARELLALAESDTFTAEVKPNNAALLQAQRQALRELSSEALRALYWYRYGGPLPEGVRGPEPPLYLPAPALAEDPTPSPEPPQDAGGPPADASDVIDVAPEPSEPPPAGGPGYRVVKQPETPVFVEDEKMAWQRWDSPWRINRR
jgi:hypothetical protein